MTKARMYLDIEYDDGLTDADSIASALDILMETALSTPDIFAEYGNLRIGPFYVADRETTNDLL